MKITFTDVLQNNNVWKVIKWFCNWYFGDDYDTKVIIYETERSICCRYIDEYNAWLLTVANFKDEQEKNEMINEWEKFERPKE